jgi:hypothetical protein
VVELQTRLAEVARRLAEAEEAWLVRHDALERAAVVPSPLEGEG